MTEGRYLLTVRAMDGSVVRQHRYDALKEIAFSNAAPTLEELMDGHSGEVRDGRPVPWGWEPVNQKVLPLVKTLFTAGVVTTGSGDLYGDDLVYVDLADEWKETATSAALPPGWMVSVKLGDVTREVLGLPPQALPDFNPDDEVVEGIVGDNDALHAVVRLCRIGGDVMQEEADSIMKSLLRAKNKS